MSHKPCLSTSPPNHLTTTDGVNPHFSLTSLFFGYSTPWCTRKAIITMEYPSEVCEITYIVVDQGPVHDDIQAKQRQK